MAEKTFETSIVSFLTRLPDLVRQRAESLEEFNAILNNEYMTLVEDRLLNLDYIPPLLDRLTILISCNTITSVSLLAGVPDVDVLGTLDAVSTRRSALDTTMRSGSKLASMAIGESRRGLGLPSYDTVVSSAQSGRRRGRFQKAVGESSRPQQGGYRDDSLTGDNSRNRTINNDNRQIQNNQFITATDNSSKVIEGSSKGGSQSGGSVTLGKDAIKNIFDQDKLGTGRQFSVVFERNGNRLEVPMRTRLAVKSTTQEMMQVFLGFADQTSDFWNRWMEKQSGIKSWRDILFSTDIRDEYIRNRYKDNTGFYKNMFKNKNQNWLSGVLSLSPSINNASSIMVVSADTVDSVAIELGGTLDEYEVRQRLFENTLTQYIAVVDELYKSVTLYTRGLATSVEYTRSELMKVKGGAGNVDANKIIEAYRAGANPVL